MSMCQRTELGQEKWKELEMTRTVRLLGFSAYYRPRQKEGVLRGLGHFGEGVREGKMNFLLDFLVEIYLTILKENLHLIHIFYRINLTLIPYVYLIVRNDL